MRKEKVSKCENGQQKVCKFQYTSHAKGEPWCFHEEERAIPQGTFHSAATSLIDISDIYVSYWLALNISAPIDSLRRWQRGPRAIFCISVYANKKTRFPGVQT